MKSARIPEFDTGNAILGVLTPKTHSDTKKHYEIQKPKF